MTVRNKGPKTLRTSGNLGRRIPNADAVALFVMNGIAVGGGAQLGVLYNIQDMESLGINAAYDATNTTLVYHHISSALAHNPSLEGYFFLCPQKVVADHITPAVMCDKAEAYVAKALSDAITAGHKIKLLTVAMNPAADYAPTITTGMDASGITAKAKLQELLALQEDQYNFINASLEARSFSGTVGDLVNVEVLSANLAAPRIRFVIAADPAISAANARYNGYAAVGDELGMASLAAISENYGNPITKFNLTKPASGKFLKPGLSGNVALPTDNTLLNSLETKGYVFAEPVAGLDGIYFNDSRTAVLISNDYAYLENNRVIDKMLLLVRAAILPLTTNARLQVDTTTGELTIAQRGMIEGAGEEALTTMVKDGDLSGNPSCVIPAGIDILGGDTLYVDISAVPVAIGRLITIRAGFSNPFNA